MARRYGDCAHSGVRGAQETVVSVHRLMTVEEFKAAGLDKLSRTELDALDRWLTKHTLNIYRLAQGRSPAASSSSGGYRIDAAANDETFVINGNVFKAKTYCFGFDKGDRVVFAEGNPSGACTSAKFVNMRNGNVCAAWCE
jgi:hypothetical protein